MQVLNAQNQNQDQASDFVEVRSKKKKKKSKGSKSLQGQQAATSMDQEHQEQVAPQRNDTAVIIGDSIIKGLRNDLLSRATKRRVTVRSFPGASSSDMKLNIICNHLFSSSLVKLFFTRVPTTLEIPLRALLLKSWLTWETSFLRPLQTLKSQSQP